MSRQMSSPVARPSHWAWVLGPSLPLRVERDMALLNSQAVSDLLFLDKGQEALELCGTASSLGS